MATVLHNNSIVFVSRGHTSFPDESPGCVSNICKEIPSVILFIAVNIWIAFGIVKHNQVSLNSTKISDPVLVSRDGVTF